MKKKRERLDVIHDILICIRDNHNSIRPTKLLHSSNLSPQMFNEYKKELLEKDFIIGVEDNKGKLFFSLTKKGLEFIDGYKTFQNFISNFGL